MINNCLTLVMILYQSNAYHYINSQGMVYYGKKIFKSRILHFSYATSRSQAKDPRASLH